MAIQGLWAVAMWGPGLAAILTTTLVLKQPFRSLNLNRLGPKRLYLWAWFLPVVLSILGGLFTLLFGLAKLDLQFTLIRHAMASAAGTETIPAWRVVALQTAFAITLAPFINLLFALGEELGWRGFLLPQLMPLGQWKAILISGAIWGLWHAPAIVQGLNYPGYPVAGIFMMVVFCMLLAMILSWLYLNTKSPWISALAHGAVNATAGLPALFFKHGLRRHACHISGLDRDGSFHRLADRVASAAGPIAGTAAGDPGVTTWQGHVIPPCFMRPIHRIIVLTNK